MRNLSGLLLMAFLLNGCMISGPLALLPPTARYLLSSDSKKENTAQNTPISVADMLQTARDFTSSGTIKTIAPIEIPYDNVAQGTIDFDQFAAHSAQDFHLTCGPYTLGSPILAASLALKACQRIQKKLQTYTSHLSVRFSPKAKKGYAILSLRPVKGDEDA